MYLLLCAVQGPRVQTPVSYLRVCFAFVDGPWLNGVSHGLKLIESESLLWGKHGSRCEPEWKSVLWAKNPRFGRSMTNVPGRFMYITTAPHLYVSSLSLQLSHSVSYLSINQQHQIFSTIYTPPRKKMHAFISLGLLASSVAASALTKRCEDLQPCGNAFYVPSQVCAPPVPSFRRDG